MKCFCSCTTSSHKMLLLFALLFLIVLGVRLHKTFSLTTLTHDGSISYSAAAGQHNAFSRAISVDYAEMVAQWNPASTWRTFLVIDSPFCFSEIQSGLKKHDIHPPLYFWMLHLMMLVVGTQAWAGPLLNVLIACGTAGVLYLFAKRCLGKSSFALAVVIIWFAAPPVVGASMVARQYDLMTLLGLLLIWRTVLFVQPERTMSCWDYGIIVLVSMLGMLTHFHFALVMAGCGLYLTLQLNHAGWKRWLLAGLSMAAGVGLFLLIYGDLRDVVARADVQRQAFSWDGIAIRRDFIWKSLSAFWGDSRVAPNVTLGFLGLSMLYAVLTLVASWIKRFSPKVFSVKVDFPIVFFFCWTLGITSLLYLTYRSPGHAMGNRYLMMTWPFMACLIVAFFRWIPRVGVVASWILALFMIVTSFITDVDTERDITPQSNPVPVFEKVDAIIIDSHLRGFLLPVLFVLDDETWLFIGKQKEILEKKENLLSKKFALIAIYNMNFYGNTQEMSIKMKNYLRQEYFLQVQGTVWNAGYLLVGSRALANPKKPKGRLKLRPRKINLFE